MEGRKERNSGPVQKIKTTVAVIMIDASGRVLMQHRDNKAEIDYPDSWTVPGGSIDDGESLEEAATREFLEETGYRLANLRFLVSDSHLLPNGSIARRHFFWSTYDGSQELYCYEGQALRFASPEEFSKMNVVPGLDGTIYEALAQWAAGYITSSEDGA